MQNIVDRTKEKWNKEADEFNQWGSLCLDEILQLIIDEEKFTSTNSAIVPLLRESRKHLLQLQGHGDLVNRIDVALSQQHQ